MEKLTVEIFVDPGKHGYSVCPHCNGYGSSLKESAEDCSVCGGSGLVKKTTSEVQK